MKYIVIVPSGATDEPLEALDGRTPLAAATLPTLNALARQARLGTAALMPAEKRWGTEWARAALLGYDPLRFSPARGALEALAWGVRLGRRDRAFRLSLVTVNEGRLTDPTAGRINRIEAERLIEALRPVGQRFELHVGAGHRNLLVWRECGPLSGLRTTAPQHVLDESLDRYLPAGRDSRPLVSFIRAAGELLAAHEINGVRVDLGEPPANGVWVWGEGALSAAPGVEQRFGVRGVLLSESPVLRGLARWVRLGVRPTDAPGDNTDTDPDAASRRAKLVAEAVALLDDVDLVIVHVDWVATATRSGSASAKVAALEQLDREVVAPLLQRLHRESQWRMLVIPDYGMLLRTRRCLTGPSSFLLAGTDIHGNRGAAFDEAGARAGEMHLERGAELMEYFLRR